MKRLVLFDSVEALNEEAQRLEKQYGLTFNDNLNVSMVNNISDGSIVKKIFPTPQNDIRHHMNHLIRYTECYPWFFSKSEDPRDAYTVLHSNGLACALLSLSYLRGEVSQKVKLSDHWDSNDGRFPSKSNWIEALNDHYFPRLERLESKNQDHLACPYTYLPEDTYEEGTVKNNPCQVNQFLLPLYQKIAGDIIAPNTNGEIGNIKDLLDSHLLSLHQLTGSCIQIYKNISESKNYDKKAQDNLRAHKRRLKKEYRTFYKELISQFAWNNDKTDFSDRVMFHFAGELIYHADAIVRLERDLSTLDLADDDKIQERLERLNAERQIPIVFHVDKLNFSACPPMGSYCDYLKALAISLYKYADDDLATACSLITGIISKEKDLFPKPCCKSDCIAEEPSEFPEEHQGKHWLIVKAAAVCACYQETVSYANHSYDTRSYPEFYRTLSEIDTVTNNPPLVIVEKIQKQNN